jgi:heme/copper-type cytochrome/quinol oxidase subunit 2
MIGLLAVCWLLVSPSTASASFLSPEGEDAVAGFLGVAILFIVPVVLIVLFWMVHVMPEKIAHKRHHPQFEAIRTLCLLSLVFGGLLWPIAWLWAYTKPVGYKLAYGTDKHPDYFADGHGSGDGDALADNPGDRIKALRAELAALEAAGAESEAR